MVPLRTTRRITVAATVMLLFQLYGNLYEEVVTNVGAIANPVPGRLVGPLSPGSPVFFYLPWVPIGLVLVFVLTWRLRRAPGWIVRRLRAACALLLVAAAVKVYLIGWVNPAARDAQLSVAATRAGAVQWAYLNGVAVVCVAIALVLLLSWRTRVVDRWQFTAIRPTLSRPSNCAATGTAARQPEVGIEPTTYRS